MEKDIKSAIAEFNAITVQQLANLDEVALVGRNPASPSPMFEAIKNDFEDVNGAQFYGGYIATYLSQWDRANTQDDFVPKTAILQLREGDEQHSRRFAEMSELVRMGEQPRIENYEIVYIENGLSAPDEVYHRFNGSALQPINYYGHSVSVGDIIVSFTNTVEAKASFVNRQGFTELPKDFLNHGTLDKIRLGMDVKVEHDLLASIHQFALKYDLTHLREVCDNNPRETDIKARYDGIFRLADQRGIPGHESSEIQSSIDVRKQTPPAEHKVIQGTIQFYDSRQQARRLLLVAGQTENNEYICFNITSDKTLKDNAQFPGSVFIAKTAENGLSCDSFVKCDVEYIISKDSIYADIKPTHIKLGNSDYNRVMARYEMMKGQDQVRRVYNGVDSKQDEFERLRQSVLRTAEEYKRDPKLIAELMDFRSRFYNYSFNNVMLIKMQNRYSTFVASFQKWKQLGYSVNRGEKGMKILAPYEVTYYKHGEKWENVRYAPRDILEKVYKNEIETMKKTFFTVGHVFDISQTNCPKQDYPKFYDMGYESAGHAAVYECVKAFAEESGFRVIEDKIDSIALKGFYRRTDDSITINSRLADSEKLATMTHEFSHALMHKTSTQPTEVKEFEAECLSHMILKRFGMPLGDTNKDYLAGYYGKVKADEIELDKSFKRISKAYNHATEGIDRGLKAKGIEIGLDRNRDQRAEQSKIPPEKVNANFIQDIE